MIRPDDRPDDRLAELVVPLRGRPSELLALQYARWAAEASGAAIVPVHHVGVAATDAQVTGSVAAVEELLDEAGVDAPVRPLVGGKVSESIVELLASHPQAVVVLRSRCREPLGQLLWGSVAVEVARRSPVPVLVVGPSAAPPAPGHPIRDVVIAVDGTPTGERVLMPALGFAHSLHLGTGVLGVSVVGERGMPVRDASPDSRYLRGLGTRLSAIVPDDRRRGVDLIEAPTAGAGLATVAAGRPDAIVAVASYAPVISRRFAEGSVAVEVAARAAAPVLVIGPSVVTSDPVKVG